jgi:uncharacterized protein YraI
MLWLILGAVAGIIIYKFTLKLPFWKAIGYGLLLGFVSYAVIGVLASFLINILSGVFAGETLIEWWAIVLWALVAAGGMRLLMNVKTNSKTKGENVEPAKPTPLVITPGSPASKQVSTISNLHLPELPSSLPPKMDSIQDNSKAAIILFLSLFIILIAIIVGSAVSSSQNQASSSIITTPYPSITPWKATSTAYQTTPSSVPSVSTACVIANSLNIRSGPGLEYSVVAGATRGQCFKVNQISANGAWAQIDGGWASTKYLDISSVDYYLKLEPTLIAPTTPPTIQTSVGNQVYVDFLIDKYNAYTRIYNQLVTSEGTGEDVKNAYETSQELIREITTKNVPAQFEPLKNYLAEGIRLQSTGFGCFSNKTLCSGDLEAISLLAQGTTQITMFLNEIKKLQ